jgi:beta-lactamase class A
MKRLALVPLLFLALSCATAHQPRSVDDVLAAHPRQTIGIAYYDLATGETFERNGSVVFHAASTMKVPVMLGIFEAVTRGELQLDQPVLVRNQFTSILDGSQYALESREDSDPALYEEVGRELALENLVRRMIVRSSNLATNNVIELIGAKRVMALMKEIGANDIQVLRGVEDDKAYHAGMNNTTTAHDLMLVFKTLGERKAVNAEASRMMLDILAAQEFNDAIPGGVPKGTPVAHKTGSITGIAHDGGLVNNEYVLVVLTKGFKKHDDAEKVIAEISRIVWEQRHGAAAASAAVAKR